MNRRTFISALSGAFLAPAVMASARQAATPDPATLPQHSGRPRPIVLGDGIELVDYRIYPSPDVPRIIGEIWNTRDDMVDAPVISLTFPDIEEADGFAWAPPVLPVLHRGQSSMIFGVLPNTVNTNQQLSSADFKLCTHVGPGEYTEHYEPLRLEVTRTVNDLGPASLNVQGKVTNTGSSLVRFTNIRGLVRDQFGRYTGCTTTTETGDISPNESKNYSLWAGGPADIPADPYLLLDGNTNYIVDVIPGRIVPLTTPGCSYGTPWS